MSIIQGSAKQGATRGFYPVSIDQSLRFNDDDSAYLSRTPASSGNRKTWTWSGWVKRGNLGVTGNIFTSPYSGSDNFLFRFISGDTLQIVNTVSSAQTLNLTPSQVFRDSCAWYHVVLSIDTTQATASDRASLYINGTEVTAFTTATYPSQNTDLNINQASEHNIGNLTGVTQHFDGYLAEVHFTDGTAYTADAFGELKSGVWVAKSPSVTYGTNGFYLDFANSADIGNDVSGEGNDWTPNNFTASDVVLDSPTDNFCVMNPLSDVSSIVLSDGNLTLTSTVDDWPTVYGTMGLSSGQFYCEVSTSDAERWGFGFSPKSFEPSNSSSTTLADGYVAYSSNPLSKYDTGTRSFFTETATFAEGDILQVAIDIDAGKIWYGVNGSWLDSGNPSTGANPSSTFTAGTEMFPKALVNRANLTANFGQLGFTYTPPTDYLALSTANLPESTISPADDASPEDYFNTVLYTGNGTTGNSITGVGFQPDLVWVKERSAANSNQLVDVIRGVNNGIFSDLTLAEIAYADHISSFNTDGFTVGANNNVNKNAGSFVAWNWKANGSGVSNTVGDIASTVSANTTSGFSIVSYTGNGSSNQTVGHGLSQPLDMFVVKNRDGVGNWLVYHKGTALGATAGDYLILNTTGADANSATLWESTIPTSTVFTVGSNSQVNGSADAMIAYCFHSVEGFSKFGSYTGNGSTDGPFVYTGFRPSFIMLKRTNTTGNWAIFDIARETYNVVEDVLTANTSNAEGPITGAMDILSNGFKLRTANGDLNASGGTYIFMAFAEDGGPFKYSLAR